MTTRLARSLLPLALLAVPAAGAPVQDWSWSEQSIITNHSVPTPYLGASLALDGDTALIGSRLKGLVMVFGRSESGWSQEAVLMPSTNETSFGNALALSGDTAVVGAPLDDESGMAYGAVHVFERDLGGPQAWGLSQRIELPSPTANAEFGTSLAFDGSTLVIGAPRYGHAFSLFSQHGAAFVFERGSSSGPFSLSDTLGVPNPFQNEQFGTSMALEGSRLLVGAPGLDAALLFDRGPASGPWQMSQQFLGSDYGFGQFEEFGAAVDLEGSLAAVGASSAVVQGLTQAGSVSLFRESGASWSLEGTVDEGPHAAGGKLFGGQLSLSAGTLLAGAPRGNAAYLFRYDSTAGWNQALRIASEAEEFGSAVAHSAGIALVGAEFYEAFEGSVQGLTSDPASGELWGVTDAGDFLAIDSITGETTRVGPTGYSGLESLALEPASGLIYSCDDTGLLLTIDPSSGVGTAVGQTGYPRLGCLAFNPITGVLYGAKEGSAGLWKLVTLSTTTGAGSAVGSYSLGSDNVKGLAYDSASGQLLALIDNDQLYTLDQVTGNRTLVGTVGPALKLSGLTEHPSAQGSHTVLSGQNGSGLHALDPAALQTTVIGPLGGVGAGGTFELELSAPSTAYCTAGTSADGCVAQLSTGGIPSATVDSGFRITATSVEGQKDGLFFFGVNGRQANPWGSGTSLQCIVPPVTRTGLMPATGTAGTCDGSFSRDLNATWCSTCPNPAKNPGSGVTVQAQLWYRDPLSTSNQTTSLSDAIEFTTAP